MEIENAFRVDVPVDEAWRGLLDLGLARLRLAEPLRTMTDLTSELSSFGAISLVRSSSVIRRGVSAVVSPALRSISDRLRKAL